ncbi:MULTISPECIES: response regulator [Streptomyces]|uniref:DNA-binding response regulator n=1 Tax=Streptomyces tsukubensis (strain DSM 42081 / NBRC 108919 / NRRL 18488 / 9993) TaxID=1114943 RepID=I2N1D3_STRT9|nr:MULTISPECIES: response regulator transcription factor [Streptomyces]AZK94997.1 DNA-binding response regulator [Streptomyces tsukubensis]EIF90830.1 transcriptional regulatory protein liaR [Streptomyces tsukubensis NRRL18488]MYS63242.1 response regulator [Streptomyces sp. SID5473]QKM68936.1 DNA-binding response regulator [Streptomyces tsukubensis NRRL18488]TAI43741.1 response regulator transcription factor [Streptomyces tsukubensis]
MTAAPVRILLVDDQPLVRAGLRVLIADHGDLEIVGEAGTGDEAVRLTARLRPDVVVMDIRMPGTNGIDATALITGAPDPVDTRVLVLTTFDDDEYVYGALRAGASGFLVKDMDMDDILAAIRVVAAGDALIAPSVTRRLIEEFAARPAAPPGAAATPLTGITGREREVLVLVGRGLSNAEIAAELFITPATVKAHVGRLLTKLAARDRIQLVIHAYDHGLVAPR